MKGLIPCPHCGGEADIYHGDSTDGYIRGTGYVEAFCGWCGARIRGRTDEEVIEKWNRRDYGGNQGKLEENPPDWIYVEDRLPPLGEDVVVIAEVNMGIGSSLVKFVDSREQRTGWGRTIECWRRDVNATRLAWLPLPKFRRKK